MMDDLQKAFDEGFEAVRGYVDRSFAAFERRIEALEANKPEPLPDVPVLVRQHVAEAVSAIKIPVPQDGKSVDPAEVERLIAAAVEKSVAALPKPQDGRSVTPEELVPLIEERLPVIVSEAVRAIPVPKDGADGRDGTDGLPGRGLAKLLIDAKGHLVATFTDGSTDEVGLIVGKDGAPGRDGVDGKDGVAGERGADGKDGADGASGRDGSDGKNGMDGKSVEIDAVADMVRAEVEKIAPELVQKAVDAIPRPADGKDGLPGERGEKGEPGNPGNDGQKGDTGAAGKSVTPDDVRPILSELVDTAVKALPVPKDGRSVTVEDVEPLIAKQVSAALSEAVRAIPVPKDGKDGRDGADGNDGEKGADGINGRDGLDAVTPILKDGVLMFTMSDGTVKEVGHIAGADGKDGAPGKDGADGLGFDDLTIEYDGERTITARFEKGDIRKDFPLVMPIVLDRGVWQERGIDGGGYKKGDAVSWGGSLYIARKDTFAKPDDFDAWRLSVKRGKDAKEPVSLK